MGPRRTGRAETAAYLTVTNGTSSDDALVGVSTTAATERRAPRDHDRLERHDRHADDEPIKVPAGGSVALQPGGYHVMLTGLTSELKAGSSVELVLTFERAGVVKVTAEVRAS